MLPIWTIYDHPIDYPDEFVARKFLLSVPTDELLRGPTLEAVRRQLPRGLVCLRRQNEDDPKIVETWL